MSWLLCSNSKIGMFDGVSNAPIKLPSTVTQASVIFVDSNSSEKGFVSWLLLFSKEKWLIDKKAALSASF